LHPRAENDRQARVLEAEFAGAEPLDAQLARGQPQRVAGRASRYARRSSFQTIARSLSARSNDQQLILERRIEQQHIQQSVLEARFKRVYNFDR